MRYSNGFYLFQVDSLENTENEIVIFPHRWRFIKSIDDFDCYSFSYYMTDQLRVDFDETTIWIDDSRQLLIVFTRDELLLDYVFQGMQEKFNLNCKPFELGIHSFLLQDGKSVTTSLYKQRSSNKVTTSLIRSDSERMLVIEKLINGDIYERNLENSPC